MEERRMKMKKENRSKLYQYSLEVNNCRHR